MKLRILGYVAVIPVALAVCSYFDSMAGRVSVGDGPLTKPLTEAMGVLAGIKERFVAHCRWLCDKYLPEGASGFNPSAFDDILAALGLGEYCLGAGDALAAVGSPPTGHLGPYLGMGAEADEEAVPASVAPPETPPARTLDSVKPSETPPPSGAGNDNGATTSPFNTIFPTEE